MRGDQEKKEIGHCRVCDGVVVMESQRVYTPMGMYTIIGGPPGANPSQMSVKAYCTDCGLMYNPALQGKLRS